MLRLPPFTLLRPRTLAEAAHMLTEEGAAAGPGDTARAGAVRLVAGGTDLWPNMKRRNQKAATVVSLMAVPGLAGIEPTEEGGLRIGATTLLDDVARYPAVVARYPALATAVASISSPPLRNMGTLGGNVCVDTRCTYYNQTEEWRRSIDYCMKEEGHICWVATSSPRCWAHTASDSAPVLCALGATVRLISSGGERVIPLADLYRDDGMHYLNRRADEILTAIELPAGSAAAAIEANGASAATGASTAIDASATAAAAAAAASSIAAAHPAGEPANGGRTACRSAFWKLRRRGSIDFAVLSVAAAVWTDDAGTITSARLYLGAVGSSPTAATAAAAGLVGQPLRALAEDDSPDSPAATAGRLARKVAIPMDNTDFQAQWRGLMAARYTEAALRELAGGDRQRLAPRHLISTAPSA